METNRKNLDLLQQPKGEHECARPFVLTINGLTYIPEAA
jgi:hypothetical protein